MLPALLLLVLNITNLGQAPPTSQPSTQPTDRGPATVELLEDNADTLLPLLNNPGGDPGAGYVERDEVFSGTSAVRIGPLQRFSPKIPGWSYRIVADAQESGEFRYLRFAWKSRRSTGIMIQFHDGENWTVRYYAGVNQFDWQARSTSDKVPEQWTLVTVDLFAEYGPRTLQGMALTTFDGQAGFFDHIYLGRTIPDLDRIDANGLRKLGKPVPALNRQDLDRLWGELVDPDASKAYRAFWTLVASPEQAQPYLTERLEPAKGRAAIEIAALIEQMGDADWRAREKATAALRERVHDARPQLAVIASGGGDVPPEVSQRAAALLSLIERNEAGPSPRSLAAKALEYMVPAR